MARRDFLARSRETFAMASTGTRMVAVDVVIGASSLCLQWRRPLLLNNVWRAPFASQGLRPRRIEPHGEVERALWRGQPIRLQVSTWALVLETQIERAVAVVLEGHPTADSEAVQTVRNLKAILVVQRD